MPLIALLILLGALEYSVVHQPNISGLESLLWSKNPIQCEAVVVNPVAVITWGVRVDARIKNCRGAVSAPIEGGETPPLHDLVRLSIAGEFVALSRGDVIKFKAKFYLPREFKNPGVFSYRKYLDIHGVGATGYVNDGIEVVERGTSFISQIDGLRQKIRDSILLNVGTPANSLLVALAIGDQGAVDEDIRYAFATSGLAHLLALSGLNVACVGAVIYFLISLLSRLFPKILLYIPRQKIAASITIPAIWMYALIAGGGVSVVRAAIMLTVFLLGIIIYRRQDLLSTFSFAVIVILILYPLSVLDVSFQLSVIAVAGLVLITPPLIDMIRQRVCRGGVSPPLVGAGTAPLPIVARCVFWFLSLVIVTLSASIATTPIVAYHFKFVTGISLFANLIAVPLTNILLTPLVFAASIFAVTIPSLATLLWKLSDLITQVFIKFTVFVSNIGEPLVFRWAPSIFEVVILYLIIISILFWRRHCLVKFVSLFLIFIFVTDVSYKIIAPRFDKKLTITVLDVNQGDSTLIRFPAGKTLLIDGGGLKGSRFDVGKNVVAPALWSMGIYRLDYVLLTHPHFDHFQGLSFIVKEFEPKLLFTNGENAPDYEISEWNNFRAQVDSSHVPIKVVEQNYSQNINGVELKIIAVPKVEGDDPNDDALVVYLQYGENKFLFPSDLTKIGEERLLNMTDDLRADFLKVGHHGSKNSTSELFIKEVAPSLAVISSGEGNRYGMPHKSIIQKLEDVGVKIFRTDYHGAVTVKSDGKKMIVSDVLCDKRLPLKEK